MVAYATIEPIDVAVIAGRQYIANDYTRAGYNEMWVETNPLKGDLVYRNYYDGGLLTDYPFWFVTSPLNVAGVNGFQRVWWIHLAGTCGRDLSGNLVDSKISVSIDYDNEQTFSDKPVNGVAISSLLVTNPDASISDVFRMRVRPGRMKCSSMQIMIASSQASSPSHWSDFSLTSMTLVCGIKRGGPKLSAARSL